MSLFPKLNSFYADVKWSKWLPGTLPLTKHSPNQLSPHCNTEPDNTDNILV